MPDTSITAHTPPHRPTLIALVGLIALVAGISLRCAAVTGELWLDELWSLLKVSDLSNPIDIVTKVKHDNNHILNSLWMWVWGSTQPSFVYRIPALACSLLLLVTLYPRKRTTHPETAVMIVWLTLVAFSYPLTLYGTEARGYSLVVLCAALAYLSLSKLLTNPFDLRAIAVFALCGIIGCLSHAIYVLFLAPAVAWLVWRVAVSRLKDNSRTLLWYGIVPPVSVALLLILTFYRGMEIGGAPLMPYLEVAASTISVSFGGETLSSVNVNVTGWSVFLALFVTITCLVELVAWIRSGDPLASLAGLILVTPWLTVAVIQPHFILPRYFIIQVLFAYLVAARFLNRLARQGRVGAAVATMLVLAYAAGQLRHTLNLATMGRSHFVQIFEEIALRPTNEERTVGGDQDFQNGLRLAYARKVAQSTSSVTYVSKHENDPSPPRFVIRERLDAYEEFPQEWRSPRGTPYRAVRRYPAPQLNGSHVVVYERLQ
jgi:hypothetical protein